MPQDSSSKAVYEERWRHAIHDGTVQLGNFQKDVEFIEQSGLDSRGKTGLEIGSGSGKMAAYLQSLGLSMTAGDLAETAVEYARKQFPQVEFVSFSAEALPFEDRRFDFVFSFDLVEHLADPDRHFREVFRVLKKNGSYLFQTPNKLSNVIFETLKTRSTAWRQYHPSLYFYGQLKRRLKKHGFEPLFMKINTMNEFALNKIRKAGLPVFLFKRLNLKYLPFCLQTNFFVIAKKP